MAAGAGNARSGRLGTRAPAALGSTKGSAAHRQAPDPASEIGPGISPAGASWLAGSRHSAQPCRLGAQSHRHTDASEVLAGATRADGLETMRCRRREIEGFLPKGAGAGTIGAVIATCPSAALHPRRFGRRTKEVTMTTTLVALVLLCLMTGTAMAQLLMSKDPPELPGREVSMIIVEHAPGGSSP